MKLSKNFSLEELVHPDFINMLGDRAAHLINPRLVDTCQALRDQVQTGITINDWHRGGNFKFSGLRPLDSTVGAKRSMHKTGKAADLKFTGLTAEKVYYHILNNQDKYPYIIRMESIDYTPSWIHIECDYDKRAGQIAIFNP